MGNFTSVNHSWRCAIVVKENGVIMAFVGIDLAGRVQESFPSLDYGLELFKQSRRRLEGVFEWYIDHEGGVVYESDSLGGRMMGSSGGRGGEVLWI